MATDDCCFMIVLAVVVCASVPQTFALTLQTPELEHAMPNPQASTSNLLYSVMNPVDQGTAHGQGLLIAVVSAPGHIKARQAIRASWGWDAKFSSIDLMFFMGQIDPANPEREHLEREIAKERDVVRFNDFIESYHNLTAKAINIFDYGYRMGYAGVMKTDDDVYLSIPRLSAFLTANPDWNDLWAGDFFETADVVKDPTGRWYAYDQYPYDKWPPYPNGPGFFLGTRAIRFISTNKWNLNRIRIDDAAVGVWLQELSLSRVRMTISFFDYQSNDDAIWVNPVNAEEMKRLHSGERLVLQICQDPKTACLCHNNPAISSAEQDQCWKATASRKYEDVVPRASHH